MAKFFGTAGVLTSMLVGVIVWIVLDVIIGIATWIAFVAGGGIALIGVLLALGVGARTATSKSHRGPAGAH